MRLFTPAWALRRHRGEDLGKQMRQWQVRGRRQARRLFLYGVTVTIVVGFAGIGYSAVTSGSASAESCHGLAAGPPAQTASVVEEPLTLVPSDVRAGETVIATAVVGNHGGPVAHVPEVLAAVRYLGNCRPCSGSSGTQRVTWGELRDDSFPAQLGRDLRKGDLLAYRQSRVFEHPGCYVAELVKRDSENFNVWGGNQDGSRVYFEVHR